MMVETMPAARSLEGAAVLAKVLVCGRLRGHGPTRLVTCRAVHAGNGDGRSGSSLSPCRGKPRKKRESRQCQQRHEGGTGRRPTGGSPNRKCDESEAWISSFPHHVRVPCLHAFGRNFKAPLLLRLSVTDPDTMRSIRLGKGIGGSLSSRCVGTKAGPSPPRRINPSCPPLPSNRRSRPTQPSPKTGASAGQPCEQAHDTSLH